MTHKPPFIWFGGKSKIAPKVWEIFGNPKNYVEPFGGSLAVLYARPQRHFESSMRVETVNDSDYFLTNFWRSVQADPEQVAHYADNPIIEADLFSRHLWLVNKGKSTLENEILKDPEFYDAKIAGWWVWGINAWIGQGWCQGTGSWGIDENGNVNKGVGGVNRQLPHLGDNGQGVNRQLPHLGNNGQGVNRQLPISSNHKQHLTTYLTDLSARLRYVRIANGDWKRLTNAAVSNWEDSAVFLDPPYPGSTSKEMYQETSDIPGIESRDWAIANGDKYKIIYAGYFGTNDEHFPSTWERVSWKANSSYTSKKTERFSETLFLSPKCDIGNNSLQLRSMKRSAQPTSLLWP